MAGQHFNVGSDAVLVARLLWDAAAEVDVDLQAVVVDTAGRITDAAYYNNMKACGGKALVHSGDEAGDEVGRGTSCEEVRITLASVPDNVHMFLIITCCYTGGVLQDVPNPLLAFEQVKPAKRPLSERSVGVPSSGLLAAVLVRRPGMGDWELRCLQEKLPGARHFMDCLPELNRLIVAEIPTANRKQKVAFAMEKGSALDFGASLQSVVLGLGWDVDQGEMDLDASAVLLDSAGEVLDSIFFGHLRSSGSHSEAGAVEHSGDNLTGEGDGDDERITVRLNKLGDRVSDVFFCIHVYSKGGDGRAKTFRDVANPYCRVVEGEGGIGEELCRYTLTDAGNRSGLVIARLRRGPGGRFGFHALGVPSTGTMYKDAIPDMQRVARLDQRELQVAQGAPMLLGSETAAKESSKDAVQPGRSSRWSLRELFRAPHSRAH
jgi:tellurium resistance protein TerZ